MKLTDKILKEALDKTGQRIADLQYIGDIMPEHFTVIGFAYLMVTNDGYESHEEYDFDVSEEIGSALEDAIANAICNNKARCNHCNARIKYAYIAKSNADGTIHLFGQTCGSGVENLKGFSLANAKDLNMRKRKQLKKQMQIKAILDENPGLEDALKANHKIVIEIASKLREYGSISPKQIELVFKLAAQTQKWAEDKAVRDQNSVDVIEGPMKATPMKVIAVKTVYDQGFGYRASEIARYAITLEHPGGFRVWGKIDQVKFSVKPEPGDTITISASLQKSEKDPKFGFFKRAKLK